MPHLNVHKQTKCTYIIYTILRDLFTPSMESTDLEVYVTSTNLISGQAFPSKTHDTFTDDHLSSNSGTLVSLGSSFRTHLTTNFLEIWSECPQRSLTLFYTLSVTIRSFIIIPIIARTDVRSQVSTGY